VKEIFISIALVAAFFALLLLRKSNKKQREREAKIQLSLDYIEHLESVLNKISREHCMTMSPKTDFHCMMPATHYYAGLPICQTCAERITAGGANPPPFPIPSHRL
jgi:hypothetical protein